MFRVLSLRGLYHRSLFRPHPLQPAQNARLLTSHTPKEPPQNLFQRVQKFVRENPYTKFSLTMIAILFGLSVSIELYKRVKTKKSPAVAIYPPKVGHPTVKRAELLGKIDSLVSQVKKQALGLPVLYLTGESGVGKTELAHQYAVHFANSCTKWFGLRSETPIILYVNATSMKALESSLKECALGLGVQDGDLSSVTTDSSALKRLASLSEAVRSNLKEKKLPLLVLVDNLEHETLPGYKAVFFDSQAVPKEERASEEQMLWSDLDGVVLTIARTVDKSLPQEHIFHVPKKMSATEGVELFHNLSGIEQSEEDTPRLLSSLQYHPLAISLCAATVKIYQSYIDTQSEHSGTNVITTYHDLLDQNSPSGDILNAVVSLYLEAAVTDERFRHAFDLLGSCDLTHPLPTSVIARHLESPFYRIPQDSLAPPPVDTAIQLQKLVGINPNEKSSFLSQLKAILSFSSRNVPSTSELAAVLATSEDRVSYLRDCPLLSFKSYRTAGFEFLQVHQSSHNGLASLFMKYTVPKLNVDGVANEEAIFNRSTWFRNYRSFDPQKALENFHRSLPGITEPGVLTREEFEKNPLISTTPVSSSTKSSQESRLNYLEYQHLVSHYHRIVDTLSEEVKSVDNTAYDTLTRRYLYPHIKHASNYPFLSRMDRLRCAYSQTAIEASLSVSSYQESMAKFKKVLTEQKLLFGEKSQTVARTLVDMGNLNYAANQLAEAKRLLEASKNIYESILSPKQATKNFPIEVGVAYSSLALVCSALNEKQQCKDLLEKALAAYQTVSPEGTVSKRQRKLVCSCLTDVAHAYLSLGDIIVAKKYIDLSMMAHKNLYLGSHPESVRTLNVSSIVYSLLGDKPESQKLRGEAGKQQAELDRQSLVA